MRIGEIGFLGVVAGVVLGGIVATTGCEGADDGVTGEERGELRGGFRFHHRHDRPDAGSDAGAVVGGDAGTTGGGSGAVTGGTTTDCDICTRAQQCCEAVAPGNDVCTFSAATCASMVGEARPAYVNACLTFFVSARGAQQPNPPAECL